MNDISITIPVTDSQLSWPLANSRVVSADYVRRSSIAHSRMKRRERVQITILIFCVGLRQVSLSWMWASLIQKSSCIPTRLHVCCAQSHVPCLFTCSCMFVQMDKDLESVHVIVSRLHTNKVTYILFLIQVCAFCYFISFSRNLVFHEISSKFLHL